MTKTYDWHVMRSMEMGELLVHPWLSKGCATRLAKALQACEDERRLKQKDKALRENKGAFDVYYVTQCDVGPEPHVTATAVRKCSQIKNPITGTWTKRDNKTGKFMDVKADAKPFKGVRKSRGEE